MPRVGMWCAFGVLATLGSHPLPAAEPTAAVTDPADPGAQLVARLELERYKATIKGLTRFGDRRQGTDRNRAAVDWIEAQLKSAACTNTERIKYMYEPAPAAPSTQPPTRSPSRVVASGEM